MMEKFWKSCTVAQIRLHDTFIVNKIFHQSISLMFQFQYIIFLCNCYHSVCMINT